MDTERIALFLDDLDKIKRKIIEESKQPWHEVAVIEWARHGIYKSKLLQREFGYIIKPKKISARAQLYKNGVDLPL